MRKQKMSVCFADMAGWARLVERIGSAKSIAVLQTMLKKAGDIILKHGGRIRKYIGDAILFTFPKPRNAVAACSELVAVCRLAVRGIDLRYAASVATGPVYVCKIGHPSLKVEDIMGSTVNRAAILEREAMRSGAGLAICEETRKLV